MRVGIDFDNTIVNYDSVFVDAARMRGWVTPSFVGSKKQLRDSIRLLDGGEVKWQILQGEVYGPRMGEAVAFPGVKNFFGAAARAGVSVCIVSHKTRYSGYDPHQTDLRQVALNWLERNGFFEPALGLRRDAVFFADTREGKVRRLAELGCAVFIDDLEEVFAHPDFPAGVRKLLFAAEASGAEGQPMEVCCSWDDINRLVLREPTVDATSEGGLEDLCIAAERLLGRPICSVAPARPGGNNRAYRVETHDAAYALKLYIRQPDDMRDRLAAEFDGLAFLRSYGVTDVPKPIVADRERGLALYDWIEGTPTSADDAGIDAALALIRKLEKIRMVPAAAALPAASEACLCPADIVSQVGRRLQALEAVAPNYPALGEFLSCEVRPALASAADAANLICRAGEVPFNRPLHPRWRCLSPSDFGFHNALRTTDGRFMFIDFEYFGWDDPAKLVCDFVLHPGMNLPRSLARRFVDRATAIFSIENPAFRHRLYTSMPLYALRWTMILLNEFIPQRWRRRVLAGGSRDLDAVLNVQLLKARAMLARVSAPTEV